MVIGVSSISVAIAVSKMDALYSYEGLRIKCEKLKLGEGGFGDVFRGSFDGQTVAVKRILHDKVDENEETFLTYFQHWNILKLFHMEQDAHFK